MVWIRKRYAIALRRAAASAARDRKRAEAGAGDHRIGGRIHPSPARAVSRPRRALSGALEGSLKLKEISYIHAEAYPAGELKHGPLALVDEDMPVVAVAPNGPLLDKLKSNLQEVRARGGRIDRLRRHRRRHGRWQRHGGSMLRVDPAAASSRRPSSPCRCSCWPITSPCCVARTSISRAISLNQSRWNVEGSQTAEVDDPAQQFSVRWPSRAFICS
jgi:hypothetical protein